MWTIAFTDCFSAALSKLWVRLRPEDVFHMLLATIHTHNKSGTWLLWPSWILIKPFIFGCSL